MYVPIRFAAKHYNVSDQTIRAWGEKDKLEFITLPSGQKRYRIRGNGNVDIKKTGGEDEQKEKERVNICYCRVSSSGQKEDLQRQIQYMESLQS
jgi:predicted site-specific integrase-resolvase